MALGWAAMLALLGFWSGTVNGPAPCSFPEERCKFVSPEERFEQKAKQALILGQSI